MELETNNNKVEKVNVSMPVPTHLSFFPQLSYAILRTTNWDKNITNTTFFIGRN